MDKPVNRQTNGERSSYEETRTHYESVSVFEQNKFRINCKRERLVRQDNPFISKSGGKVEDDIRFRGILVLKPSAGLFESGFPPANEKQFRVDRTL